MNLSKKQLKEQNIILAAEKVFGTVGFRNAKMDDIAAEAGITKVTLYAYFQSKENLYMAITFKGFQALVDSNYNTVHHKQKEPGIESALALMEDFMSFCEAHFLYSEAILDYFSLIRSASDGMHEVKLTDAIKESIYYKKMQDIQNFPFKLSAQEIERGQKDGSILNLTNPMFLSLHAWMQIVGYVKILNASSDDTILFNVDLKDLKTYTLNVARAILKNDIKLSSKYQIKMPAEQV